MYGPKSNLKGHLEPPKYPKLIAQSPFSLDIEAIALGTLETQVCLRLSEVDRPKLQDVAIKLCGSSSLEHGSRRVQLDCHSGMGARKPLAPQRTYYLGYRSP